MSFPKQLTPTQAKKYKAHLITEQKGLCKLCGRPLGNDTSKIHLDHCHDTGHVRGALHSHCNRTEGRIKNIYKRFGGDPNLWIEWLLGLNVYLQQDSSDNPLHPQHILDQTKKFKALTKPEQEQKLVELSITFDDKSTKADLTKKYADYLKKFTKIDLK